MNRAELTAARNLTQVQIEHRADVKADINEIRREVIAAAGKLGVKLDWLMELMADAAAENIYADPSQLLDDEITEVVQKLQRFVFEFKEMKRSRA